MTRYVLASLVLTLCFSTPAPAQDVFEIDLPEPPEAFTWQLLPEIKAAFLLPDEWHFKSEEQSGTNAYFLSREDPDELGYFDTGLTINVVREVGEKTGHAAPDYARAFAALAGTLEGQEALERSEKSMGPFSGFTTRYRSMKPTGDLVVIHQLVIGNAKTDTFYLIMFESPEESWEEAWQLGQPMTEMLIIDLSI